MTIVNTIYLNGCNYQFGYDVLSQSIANNSSTVRFYGVLNVTNNYVSWSSGGAWVNYSTATLSSYYSKGTYVVVQGDYTFTHNADGNLTIEAGFGINTTYVSGSATATFSLPKINRIATITSAPNFNDESNPTITYSNPAGNNVSSLHTCIASSDGSTIYIPYREISRTGTSYTYNFTDEERNILRQLCYNKKSMQLAFFVRTTIGSNMYFSHLTKTFSIVNANPTFDDAYEDTNSTTIAITNNNQQIIRNNSTLEINVTNMASYKYATLSSVTATIDGTTYSGTIDNSTCTIDVGTLNLSSNENATITVTDSRGNSTSKTLALEILDWQLPTGLITLERESNYYSETNITVDANYSSLDNKNAISIKVRYKKASDSNYGSYVTLQDNVESTLTLDNLYTWDVQVLIEDLLGSTTYNQSLGIGLPILYIDRLKRSIGIECFPNDNNSLEIQGKNVITEIENLQIYSTTETSTGKIWVDGKPIYRTVVYVSSLPNIASTTYNHNIADIDEYVYFNGVATRNRDGFSTILGTYRINNESASISLFINSKTQFILETGMDRSDMYAYITFEYTKTTD